MGAVTKTIFTCNDCGKTTEKLGTCVEPLPNNWRYLKIETRSSDCPNKYTTKNYMYLAFCEQCYLKFTEKYDTKWED